MEKKTLALGLIAVIAVGFGITGVVLFFVEAPPEGGAGPGALPTTLVFGTMYIVVDLDPQGSWDSASMDVIDHVCEGLLAYDFFEDAGNEDDIIKRNNIRHPGFIEAGSELEVLDVQ